MLFNGIKCQSCGKEYSLEYHTVCPFCFQYPKKEQVEILVEDKLPLEDKKP